MIDYRELLQKYMDHVSECEGITFVGRIGIGLGGNDVRFSADEVAELQMMAGGEDAA